MYSRNLFYTCLTILLLLIPFWVDFSAKNTKNNRGSNSNKTVIKFWQYWSGEEKEALVNLVNKFNQENPSFSVELQTISLPRKKVMMAIAAKVPPDLVLLDGDMVTDFALRNALTPLDEVLEDHKDDENAEIAVREQCQDSYEATKSKLLPAYLEMLKIPLKNEYEQVALPIMPTAEALHINKTLLKKYHLKSPGSLNDLVIISKKIGKESNFKEFGWLPTWPVWSGRFIVTAFNGNWHKANSKENIAAWTWVLENFIKDIPPDKLQGFIEGNISYQSPDNPFYSGQVAVETSGIWEHGFSKKFAPQYEIEIKKFPSISGSGFATEIAVDALAIPHAAKHPREALRFMLWLLKEENISYLALAQKKFPPLKLNPQEKTAFIKQHPNPYIEVFMDLAENSHEAYFPHFSFSKEYKREIKKAYDKVLRQEMSPKEALDDLQKRKEAMEKRS